MKRIGRYVRMAPRLLSVLTVLFTIGATCGKPRPPASHPRQAITFTDEVRYHNASITWDGRHYLTINGGNSGYCDLNEYDRRGRLLKHHDVGLDGRAIFYSAKQPKLLVKNYGRDLYEVDLKTDKTELVLSDVFQDDNTSPGFSPDGRRAYELVSGTVHVYDLQDGSELSDFELDEYFDEDLYDMAVAVSDAYLFAWRDSSSVAVYTLNGEHVTDVSLPRVGYAMSLSYCNGMLWFATDADGTDVGAEGRWYGLKL
jgi:hypothetical protein